MIDAPYPADAPPAPAGKPYRVTAYRTVRSSVVELGVVGDYRWYWQANLVNWFYHHFWGYGCNTWKAKGMA